MVGSMRWRNSAVTGRLLKIEMPRSPCSGSPEPQDELLVKRQIETELAADRLDLLLGRLIARDHAGRIAGRDMQDGEHHQCHDGEHRDGRQDAAEDRPTCFRRFSFSPCGAKQTIAVAPRPRLSKEGGYTHGQLSPGFGWSAGFDPPARSRGPLSSS